MRAIIVVLDSFGLGASDDASAFGDEGADTFGHIAQWCAQDKANREGVRSGRLHIPNLMALGLGLAAQHSSGKALPVDKATEIQGKYGFAAEVSKGKDTPSGHWEIAGVPVEFDWGYFSLETPSFPPELIEALVDQGKLAGVLGNCHASGTIILDQLGEEHIRTARKSVV